MNTSMTGVCNKDFCYRKKFFPNKSYLDTKLKIKKKQKNKKTNKKRKSFTQLKPPIQKSFLHLMALKKECFSLKAV